MERKNFSQAAHIPFNVARRVEKKDKMNFSSTNFLIFHEKSVSEAFVSYETKTVRRFLLRRKIRDIK